MGRRVRWFSEGAASAVATMLDIRKHGLNAGPVVTCSTGAEDEDNLRFRAECEAWFGAKVTVLRSSEYESTWDVWEKRRYMAGPDGATCTGALKVVPRLDFQLPSDLHVFGYTSDAADRKRADNLRETYPQVRGDDGKRHNIRAFIDDIPLDWPTTNAIAPRCDLLCAIHQQELEGGQS